MNEAADKSSTLTTLESAVLAAALAPDQAYFDRFRAQVAAAVVTSRTPSGVGFMTKIEVPAELAVAEWPAHELLPVVAGSHPDLAAGAEFILQVKSGCISTIEAFCYEGMWPQDEEPFQIEISA